MAVAPGEVENFPSFLDPLIPALTGQFPLAGAYRYSAFPNAVYMHQCSIFR